MAYKSGNPALNNKTFDNLAFGDGTMTLNGVAAKSLLMLVLAVTSGVFGWRLVAQNPDSIVLVFGALIIAFIIGLITVFVKKIARFTAPIYAILEGFVLGALSQLYETEFQGIVLQALLLTGGIFVSMLLLYLTRIIKPTENLKLGIAAATGGIAVYYLANFVVNFFGKDLPLINSNSGWGIGFTVIIIIIAALNLVVDFDFIEQGVEKRAPKYMEWYASFGLFVTIVWLYLEILRLLAKLRSR